MDMLSVLRINCRNYWRFNKLLPVGTFALIYIVITLSPVKEAAKTYGEVIPWSIWGLLFTDEFFVGLTMTSVFLLFSSLPFDDALQTWLILKVGYRKWGLGQMIYIVLSSLLFTLGHFIMTIIYLMPHGLPLSSWGRLIKNLARGYYTLLAQSGGVKFAVDALDYYDPLAAILQVLGMVFLISCLLGMVVFVFNLLVPRLGFVLSGGLIVLSFFFSLANRLWIYYLSPLIWLSLYQVRHAAYSSLPTLSQVVTWAIGLNVLVGLIGYFYLRRKEVYHA